MQHERITRGSHAATLSGWISNLDAIFVGLILTLTVTLFAYARIEQSEANSNQLLGRADSLQAELSQANKQLNALRRERALLMQNDVALQKQLAERATRMARLQGERNKETVAASTVVAERGRLDNENKSLKSKLATLGDHFSEMERRWEQIVAEKRNVDMKLVSVATERDAARRESDLLRDQINAAAGFHKELIGLKGEMGRVAILFDTSSSMAQKERWDHAQSVVAAWLEHLNIGECVLILFSTDANVFPESGALLNLRGPTGEVNRKRLVERIKSTKPHGRTNTLLALQTAYRYSNIDTIILFTDGEPNSPNSNSNQFDPETVESIYSLCRQHSTIPVNTVGLGNYFKPELSTFLMRVSRETGGSFLGR